MSETNTLAITLPQSSFTSFTLSTLKSHFETFGRILDWAELNGLGKVIIVYEREESVDHAMSALCGGSLPSGNIEGMKVHRSSPIPREIRRLGVPPSPSESADGEVRLVEDQLVRALGNLHLRRTSTTQVLLEPSACVAGVGVYVEDCDSPGDEFERDLPEWGTQDVSHACGWTMSSKKVSSQLVVA